jgi:hypothetical protein
MKKITLILAGTIIWLSMFSTAVGAGLLPDCGGVDANGVAQPACTICNLFELIDNLITGVILVLVPVAAGLVIAIAGFKMLINQNNSEILAESKKIILMVIIGLALIYGSYAIVNFAFSAAGYTEPNPLEFNKVNCPNP